MQFWQFLGVLAVGSQLVAAVLAGWLLYLPAGPGPFDVDEGDDR